MSIVTNCCLAASQVQLAPRETGQCATAVSRRVPFFIWSMDAQQPGHHSAGDQNKRSLFPVFAELYSE